MKSSLFDELKGSNQGRTNMDVAHLADIRALAAQVDADIRDTPPSVSTVSAPASRPATIMQAVAPQLPITGAEPMIDDLVIGTVNLGIVGFATQVGRRIASVPAAIAKRLGRGKP